MHFEMTGTRPAEADESSIDNLVRIEASPLAKSPSPVRRKSRLNSREKRRSPIKISPVKAKGARAEGSSFKHDLSQSNSVFNKHRTPCAGSRSNQALNPQLSNLSIVPLTKRSIKNGEFYSKYTTASKEKQQHLNGSAR